MKRIVLVLVSCLVLSVSVFTVGCQKPSVTIETLLVPEKADAIARVKIAEIINDEDAADLYARYAVTDTSAPQTLRIALDELKNETGIDLRYFNEAVLFADLSTIGMAVPYYGAIVDCNVPVKYFFEVFRLLNSINAEKQRYGNYNIYVLDGEMGIVFLNERLMAVGPVNVVKDVIDVGLGKAMPISGKVYELYDSLSDSSFRAAFDLPWMIRKDFTEIYLDQESIVELDPFQDIDMVGCILEKEESTINMLVYFYFESNLLATDASQCIKDLIITLKYIWPLPELCKIIDRTYVEVYGNQISIELAVTSNQIKDLISALESENIL